MNLWYAEVLAGIILFLESLVSTFIKIKHKDSMKSELIKVFSGVALIILGAIAIKLVLFGADIPVQYSWQYAFTAAGFILLLRSFFSYIGYMVTNQSKEISLEEGKIVLGCSIFILGTILVFVFKV